MAGNVESAEDQRSATMHDPLSIVGIALVFRCLEYGPHLDNEWRQLFSAQKY